MRTEQEIKEQIKNLEKKKNTLPTDDDYLLYDSLVHQLEWVLNEFCCLQCRFFTNDERQACFFKGKIENPSTYKCENLRTEELMY